MTINFMEARKAKRNTNFGKYFSGTAAIKISDNDQHNTIHPITLELETMRVQKTIV